MCGPTGNDRLTGGAGSNTFDGGLGTDPATDYNATAVDSRVGIPLRVQEDREANMEGRVYS